MLVSAFSPENIIRMLSLRELFRFGLRQPSRSDWFVTLAYWIGASPFILSSYLGDSPFLQAIGGMAFTILFDTTSVFILVFGIFATYIPRRQYLALLVATVALFAVNSLVYNYGYGIIFGWEYRSPSFELLLWGVLRHAQSYGILAAIMIGKQFFDIQKQFFELEKEKRENELKMLKSQIDPHFLFNNLNILDVLIERDPAAARVYLNHLASLYRYLIRHKDEEVVSLYDE
ncbi:MAG: histidine kinase [Saprospiraceae bacterium]|nr:histidine kinase [Saprospiraceae bacterium]MDZ4704389.1 histidine kinase [Saprospiraceae bacterium]